MLNSIPSTAISAYFARIADGTASQGEFAILPQMLDKCSMLEKRDGDEKANASFPTEGLVSAEQVCRFIGHKGIKKTQQAIARLWKLGKFPAPAKMGTKPLRWLAQDVRDWVDSLRGGN